MLDPAGPPPMMPTSKLVLLTMFGPSGAVRSGECGGLPRVSCRRSWCPPNPSAFSVAGGRSGAVQLPEQLLVVLQQGSEGDQVVDRERRASRVTFRPARSVLERCLQR